MYRGAVAVPVNPLLKAREVAYYLLNSGARALFATPAFADTATTGARDAGARCWLVDDAGLAELRRRARPGLPSSARRRGHRGHPAHLGPRVSPRAPCSLTAICAVTPTSASAP
ncbi:hypothetical protein [Mycobacterium seoulense]|uniref:hypothetical protein n=1 Tax=Mycobacterium seoulense TaxID=386911 RepID=UPI002F96CB35